MPLFAELKRRNVFRVGAAYVALGWIVTQVTATVTPMLNLPAWLPPVMFWIGLAGFPFVLVFSWVYELTPEGLKRESEVDRTQSIAIHTARRLDLIVIALMVVAIGLFVLDRVVPRGVAPGDRAQGGLPQTDRAQGALPRQDGIDRAQGALPREGETDRAQGALPRVGDPQAVAPDPRSIAVLPFVNMSSDKEQDYFSDGISEELLNLLAKIPELRVIARTSSFAYKGKDAKIADVGRELNVAHVLEGSVRKAGAKVRITAQLVRTADSTHLWSETYDRPLDDIFAVQDEIAGAVVEQLRIKLLGAAPRTRVVKPEAYALFLQGRQVGRSFTSEGFERSTALYQQALAIDPSYAEAWRNIAANYMNQVGYNQRPIEEGYQLAREAIARALAIDPEYARAYDGLAWIAMGYDRDFAAAARHWEHALALEPNNIDIIGNASNLPVLLGRLDQSIAMAEYVAARDPLDVLGRTILAGFYLAADRSDDALRVFRIAADLSPGFLSVQEGIGEALLQKGEAEAALAAMQQEADEVSRLFGLVLAHHALGQQAEADAALATLIDKAAATQASRIALLYGYRGEIDTCFEWMEKAYAMRDPGLSSIDSVWFAKALRKDPRWLPLLRKLGIAPEQVAAIPFDVKLPQ